MKYLLFDLDRTLWDFEGNADITFQAMYDSFGLVDICHTDCHTFHEYYRIVNDQLWEGYRNGTITKEVLHVKRFSIPLEYFGVRDNVGTLALALGDYYVHQGPKQTGLMPGARHLLEYLSQRRRQGLDYTMCIITNGFSEAQVPKMRSSDIYRFFDYFFLSEDLGFSKPDTRFFQATLSRLTKDVGKIVNPSDCLVIGDDFKVDILGAYHAGIASIYYNEGRKASCDKVALLPEPKIIEVSSLVEIESIL